MEGESPKDELPPAAPKKRKARVVAQPAPPASLWGCIQEHKVMRWTLVYAAAAYTTLLCPDIGP